MYTRIFTVVIGLMVLFSINSQIFGESGEVIDISEYYFDEDFVCCTAPVIETNRMVFEIGKYDHAHVKHIVEDSRWMPDHPKLLKILPGMHSNLNVVDVDGDNLRPIGYVGETFEDSEYVILGQKPFYKFDLIMSYDLENFMEKNDSGLWHKQFEFPHDVEIYIDDEVDVVFANSRPVNISDAGGINCMGCSILIEYFDEPNLFKETITKYENKYEEISDTGKEFVLEFQSDGKISEINYIEELNYFSFSLEKSNQLVWVKIPLELMLSPYHVYFTEIDQDVLTEGDKIKKSEFDQTKTHANLSFRPTNAGFVHVVGSTEMEHERLLEQLEKRTPIPTEIVEEPSLFNPTKVEKQIEEEEPEKLYENWGSPPSSENDNTIVFVIIGIIVAVGIGIAIKLKKN